MNVRVVIFDRDNTLLHLDPGRVSELESQLRAIHPGVRFRDIFGSLEQWDGYLPTDPAAEGRLWEELVGRLGERLDLDLEQRAAVAALLAPYYEYFVAFPDSNSTVRALSAAGYQLALLTNAPLPSVDQTLRCAGVDPDSFTLRVSRTQIGAAKPDPAAFLRVAELMGVAPEQCLAIDDQLSHVKAARQCGMQAWLLDRSAPSDDLFTGMVCSLNTLARHCRPMSI